MRRTTTGTRSRDESSHGPDGVVTGSTRSATSVALASDGPLGPLRAASELWQQLVLRERQEGILVGADVVEVHVCISRLAILLDLFDVLGDIWPERQRSFEFVRLASFDELLEVARQR